MARRPGHPKSQKRTPRDGEAPPAPHLPVMVAQVIAALAPQAGETFIDATFGAGGYTRALLEMADCHVIGLDRDPTAIATGAGLLGAFAPRLRLIQTPFGALYVWPSDASPEIERPPERPTQVDGVVFDLGVSSMQIDTPERGFSFQADGPLDMRMFAAHGATIIEQRPSAADLVNTLPEEEIADILFHYGEERRSRAIARAIVEARGETPFTTTLQLAGLVSRVLGGRRGEPTHPATRTFQALRIAVNDELGELMRGLAGAERLLRPGGRLVVVTFHSLEDRIVKRFLAERSGRVPAVSRHLPHTVPELDGSFRFLNSRPLSPEVDEVAANPRARSAKLRAAVRTNAPPHPLVPATLGVPAILA